MSNRFTQSDRAVSSTVNYIQVLGIATLLISGLVFVAADVVTDQHDRATTEGLTIVGTQLAAELEATDVLVRSAGTDGYVERTVDLPTVSGGSYSVAISGTGPVYNLTLTTTESGHSVTIPFVSNTTVDAPTPVEGETLRLVYNGSSMEVRDD
ncbi:MULTISPECIES: hypothetical protein [Haloferax]|uniref:Uncharacterized protein n=1 Tax=Haloferax marinum TaxID=2666143 RepID=A0A6A8GA03_9EURY|nr:MULTISPECIES: hypothetical protein [Haloferax]KAB1191153.1 hypothetical protein Hfx1150_15845 [Haloferax sp. CBA1150]MRW98039.1 hypothetical protein [Haloferax marinum]